ncbi:hypothetical protein OGAPHI_002625 [Ogataea philodendri]|uniref:UBX domain-containing protein n=1 Tax=Ogataea philodendri TaxID=1378263 RepID=A0A9P8T862_9ASCO|nr:uncharacterized protein OGAPHI_002625 [Ogataea philodendri]KAH3668870.1 hypothetical protein OGAPHI_002625 [Ogataea philodendri]
MDQLRPEQESVLQNFKEFTSYNEDEEQDKVLRLLTVCNWNLEIAVARYFDNDFPTLVDDTSSIATPAESFSPYVRSYAGTDPFGTSAPPSREAPAPRAIAFDDPFLDLIPKLPKAIPIQNRWKFQVGLKSSSERRKSTYALLPPVIFILMLFPRLLWLVGYGLSKILGPLFPGLFRILGLRESPNDFPCKPIYTSKEAIASYNIKNYINEVLGETSDLPIFEGGFNEAFETAKSELRWLMCIIINSERDTTTKFVKTYLNHEHFIKFIKENNIILYIGDVSYPEPFEVGQTYKVYSVPHLDLISNVSATGTTFPLMSIVTRYHNFDNCSIDSAKKVTKRLQKIVDKYEPQLVTQRYDKQEAEFSRLIRKQQDEAYEQSLLNDKIKQEEKKHKELDEKAKLEKLRLKEEAVILRQKQEQAFFQKHIPLVFDRDDKDWVKGDYTTIQFRNHEGKRTVRKFFKDETLYDLFLFVECKNYKALHGDDEEEEAEDVDLDGYEHDFKFELISPMPRSKFHADKTRLLKDVKELWPNGSLLIERLEDSDDECDE